MFSRIRVLYANWKWKCSDLPRVPVNTLLYHRLCYHWARKEQTWKILLQGINLQRLRPYCMFYFFRPLSKIRDLKMAHFSDNIFDQADLQIKEIIWFGNHINIILNINFIKIRQLLSKINFFYLSISFEIQNFSWSQL